MQNQKLTQSEKQPLEVVSTQFILEKEFSIYGTVENPLFLAKDVKDWIDHANITQMLNSVDEDEKLTYGIHKSGQSRDMWFLTEDGVYETLMLSRKPKAKEFKREIKKLLKALRLKQVDIVPKRHRVVPKSYGEALIEAGKLALENEKQREQLKQQSKKIELKSDLIKGLTKDITPYQKRVLINRTVRQAPGPLISTRYSELYKVFKETFHIDLKKKRANYNDRQEKRKDHLNPLAYAEKFGYIDDLYKVACKLFETDILAILQKENSQSQALLN